MTQDILERPTKSATEAPDDRKVLDRLEAIYRRNREREFHATAEKLEALRTRFKAEREEIFPARQRESIKGAIVRGGDPRDPGLRYQSLAKARENGLDLTRLKSLHDRVYGDFAEAIRAESAFTYHDNVIGSLADVFEIPPIFYLPDPDKVKVYYPTYDGWWDRFESNQASGDGAITTNDSYLNEGMARLGSHLVGSNHDAGDVDLLCAYREGGFLVPFKTLKAGILQVTADLTALFCQHKVKTYDEWGWSEFHATTRGRLIMAVFWNWEDVDPANEVSDSWFVGGLDCSGDGESYPGTTTQATPGERRIVNLYSTMAFPKNQDLWIYVGLSDKIWAFLNDVEIDISIDSSWVLNSIGVRSL
jgi:hypothetical protein